MLILSLRLANRGEAIRAVPNNQPGWKEHPDHRRFGAGTYGGVGGDPEQDRHGDDKESRAGTSAVHPFHNSDKARSWTSLSPEPGGCSPGGFT